MILLPWIALAPLSGWSKTSAVLDSTRSSTAARRGCSATGGVPPRLAHFFASHVARTR